MLVQVVVFLGAAVVAVPISKRLGLGSVLGYLAAGVVIGPWGLRLISDVENILHFAEFGVVLLLFLIGLELQPTRLWELRKAVFGYGGVQVGLTAAALGALGLLFGLSPAAAFVTGMGLSLSSTAFALQLLTEKNQLTSDFGRASFGILLFQDLAVIPLLAALPFLGVSQGGSGEATWVVALKVVVVLGSVVLVGRYVLRPVFRFVASTRSQEVFTATALLLVVGTALLVSKVGLSMALGAFLAGVLLADSEYRHELEADIEPFKGLLLGLFFIAVGMTANLGLVVARPLLVAALVVGLIAVKAALLFGMGKVIFRSSDSALSMAVVISQGGEFAFVLFGLAAQLKIMEASLGDLLVVVVSMSMGVTPILSSIHEKWIRPKLKPKTVRAFDVAAETDAPVIIAGFGRVGQVVGRILRAKRIPFTAMDVSAEHIDFIKKFGNKVFYGDAARLDLLRAARADKAKVFVLAIDDVEASVRTAETVLHNFPHLKIVARARNRQHAFRLLDAGVKVLMRETFVSSLEMTGEVLQALGIPFSETHRALERFRAHDEQLLLNNYKFAKDEKKLAELSAKSRAQLEQLFDEDAQDRKTA